MAYNQRCGDTSITQVSALTCTWVNNHLGVLPAGITGVSNTVDSRCMGRLGPPPPRPNYIIYFYKCIRKTSLKESEDEVVKI